MQTVGATVWLSEIGPIDVVGNTLKITPDLGVFEAGGQWPAAANVFLINEQTAAWGTDAQLRTVIDYCNAHGVKLAMAGLMLASHDGKGAGVEGYGGPLGSVGAAAQRIKSLGGTISYIAMDEPLFYGHQHDGANAAQDSIMSVAQQVAVSVKSLTDVFPNIQIGDDEPIPGTADLATWEQDYRAATGRTLDFIDADVQWGSDWLPALEAQSAQCAAAGIALGVYVKGDPGQSSADWVATAEARYAEIAADPRIAASRIVIGTWDGVTTQISGTATPGTEANLAQATQAVAGLFQSGAVAGPTPVATDPVTQPLVSVPATMAVAAGVSATLGTVRIALDPSVVGNSTIAVVLMDQAGRLSAVATGGARVSGSGTAQITVSGTAAAVNATLATATVAAGGADRIIVDAFTPQGAGQASIGVTPLVLAGSIPAATRLAVTNVALQTIGRAPTSAEMTAWAAGGASAAALARLRATLAGGADAATAVKELFQSMLGVAPMPGALSAMLARLAAPGGTLQGVSDAIEAAKLDVTRLYWVLAGRAIDPGGLPFAELELEGWSSARLRAALATGAEELGHVSDAYKAAYGVAPTAATLQALDGQVGTTMSLAQLTASLRTQAAADRPAIGGVPAIVAGGAAPFGGLVLTDPVVGQIETATVTVAGPMFLSAPGLSVSGDAATVSGTATVVQAALRGLTLGGSGTVSLSVSNAAGNGATADLMVAAPIVVATEPQQHPRAALLTFPVVPASAITPHYFPS